MTRPSDSPTAIATVLDRLRRGDETAQTDLQGLLRRFRDGDPQAQEDLLRELYSELHRIAEASMRRERPGHTLQPTALINEAYLRIVGSHQPEWAGRSQFLAAAAGNMWRILVEHARRKNAHKRGGGRARVTLGDDALIDHPLAEDAISLQDALDRLGGAYPRQARVFGLRHIVGLSTKETAEAVSISERTVKSDCRLAIAWLRRELESDD